MHFKNVLVTTDFSDDSLLAFETAAYFGKMDGSTITLLSVIADWEVPETILRQIPNPESVSSYRSELQAKALEKLQQIAAEHFHGITVRCEALLSSQAAAQEITEFAKKNETNLIVMASHGRGAVGDFVLGSVVKKVIQLSECPVLVIPKK